MGSDSLSEFPQLNSIYSMSHLAANNVSDSAMTDPVIEQQSLNPSVVQGFDTLLDLNQEAEWLQALMSDHDVKTWLAEIDDVSLALDLNVDSTVPDAKVESIATMDTSTATYQTCASCGQAGSKAPYNYRHGQVFSESLPSQVLDLYSEMSRMREEYVYA